MTCSFILVMLAPLQLHDEFVVGTGAKGDSEAVASTSSDGTRKWAMPTVKGAPACASSLSREAARGMKPRDRSAGDAALNTRRMRCF